MNLPRQAVDDGQISRRQLLRGGAVLGGLAVAGLLAACGGATGAPQSPSTAAAAATPASPAAPSSPAATSAGAASAAPKVQKVVLALGTPAREANDVRNLALNSLFQLRPIYEYLIGVDPQTGKLVPELATDWNLEPDGT